MDNNCKTRAIALVKAAIDELKEAGISEQYFSILGSIASENRSAFFAHFGDENAICLEISPSHGPFDLVELSVEVRVNKPSLLSRIRRIWDSILGKSVSFKIKLDSQQVGKLKDMLTVL